jgi:hypothetical protein
MTTVHRRLLVGVVIIASLYAVTPAASAVSLHHPVVATRATAIPLDGFVITHVPGGVGPLESEFAYEWEDVAFHSRVWETGPDPEGANRVDLTVETMRGTSLRDLEAVRTYLTDYLEKDPQEWALRRVKVGRHDGYRDDSRIFWLVSRGVAASAVIDRDRFSDTELRRTARGFVPTHGPVGG